MYALQNCLFMLFQQHLAPLTFVSVLKIPLTHSHSISPVLGEHGHAGLSYHERCASPTMDVMKVVLLLGLFLRIIPLPGNSSSPLLSELGSGGSS